MKVVTLNREEFERATQRLFLEIMATELWPDVIVGIAHGGEEVADSLSQYFPDSRICIVKCCRPVSRNKKLLSPILRYLPSKVNILLRQIESRLNTMRPDDSRTLEKGIEDSMSILYDVPKVLVVDDAVDSGQTLKTVVDEVRRVWPGARIWTAAMTVTTEHPVVKPNIVLYKEPTLIRFPWSADMNSK